MGYSEHLSPEQFKFYHGTNMPQKIGNKLTIEKANEHHHERNSRGFLHFTDTPGRAADYAESRALDYGGRPQVYEVEPLGEHEHDPNDAWPSRRTKYPLRVVRKVSKTAWNNYGENNG